jgi:hypothetical protein
MATSVKISLFLSDGVIELSWAVYGSLFNFRINEDVVG